MATLAELIEEVQYEIGHSVSPAVGKNFREHVKNRIRREYRRLWHDFDWPHLKQRLYADLSAGQRYYDLPGGVGLEQVRAVWHKWGSSWNPLCRGVTLDEYNAHDSEAGVRCDPALRWEPCNNQIEIWPIPASNGENSLAIEAQKAFTQLVEEEDVCELDSDLIVLHAAAELARRWNNADSAFLLSRANQHYNTLKAGAQKGALKINFADGAGQRQRFGTSDKIFIGVDRG